MSNIQLFSMSPNLSERAKKVIENSLSPRLKPVLDTTNGHNKLYELLSSFIQKAVLVAGWRSNAELSKEERRVIINAMIEAVKRYSWLTLDDLDTIINYGLAGEFDDDKNKSYALNARTLTSWIKAYYEQIRNPAMAEQAHHVHRQSNAEDARKSDLAYEKALRANIEYLSQHCDKLTEEQPGVVDERSFFDLPSTLLPGFFMTFKRLGMLAGYESEIKAIWVEESKKAEKIKHTEDTEPLQTKCRRIFMQNHMARLMNQGIVIRQFLNEKIFNE